MLKPSPDVSRPYSFYVPRIMAANLCYLPSLQESDVLVYNPNQVLSTFMSFHFSSIILISFRNNFLIFQVWDSFKGEEKAFVRSVLRGFEQVLFNLNDFVVSL